MTRTPAPTALLALPAGAAHTALRAGLMAMRVLPTGLPTTGRERDAALGRLGTQPQTVAVIDITSHGNAGLPSLLELDALVPRGAGRSRIFLTRLAGGHVSGADRRWVQSLGFADLVPEFDGQVAWHQEKLEAAA